MGQARRKKWRVYQFIVSMGSVSSKKEAVDLARSGRLTVDGKRMESLHYQVDPRKQVVAIDGKRIELRENRLFFVFHKPVGILCTKLEILKFFSLPKDVKNSLYPVGRLDKDSSGLLVVTNDGRLGDRILNPKTKRKKVYEVVVRGSFSEEAADKLRAGVTIRTDIDDVETDYETLPAEVEILSRGNTSKLKISIYEGKKRQVRKMCKVVGFDVVSLKRIAIAKLQLGALKPGKYVEFEKQKLYKLLFE